MKFEWDEQKRLINLQMHGIDFADVWLVFEGETATDVDTRFDYGEIRYLKLGLLFGKVIAEKFGTDIERLRNIEGRRN